MTRFAFSASLFAIAIAEHTLIFAAIYLVAMIRLGYLAVATKEVGR